MYTGYLNEDLYLKMVDIINALPDETKNDPIVTAFKHLTNMTLDYLAPRTGDSVSGKRPPRNFSAMSEYLDSVNNKALQATNNVDDVRRTVDILVGLLDTFKQQNDAIAEKVNILQNQVNSLRSELNKNKETQNDKPISPNNKIDTGVDSVDISTTNSVTASNNVLVSMVSTTNDSGDSGSMDVDTNIITPIELLEDSEQPTVEQTTSPTAKDLIIRDAKKVRGGKK